MIPPRQTHPELRTSPPPFGFVENVSRPGALMGSGFVYMIDANGRKIAAVWGTPAEKIGNALLWTAAPGLLQTVKDLVGLAAGRPGRLGDYKAAIDAARALIERAEGRG